jgi:hypothetical protein
VSSEPAASLLPARSFAEAHLWAEFDSCVCGGFGVAWEMVALEFPDAQVMQIELESACEDCGRLRRLAFVLPQGVGEPPPHHFARPGDEPSALYDAGEWWALSHQYGEAADRTLAANEPSTDRDAWDEVVGYLTLSAAAMDEAIRFLPEGAAALPDGAFRTPWTSEARESSPDAFTRTSLEAEQRQRWNQVEAFTTAHPAPKPSAEDVQLPDVAEDDQADGDDNNDVFGTPIGPATRYPLARSEIEQRVFLMLHPCACGEPEFDPKQGAARTDDGAWVTWFRGRCPACGEPREFIFRQPDRMSLPPPHAWAVGPEPSQLIDPGEWEELIQKLLGLHRSDLDRRSRQERADARTDLLFAASAVEEILKFIPEGADAVPESAFRTVEGRSRWDRHPDTFRRDSLEASRDYCLSRADAIDDVGGAP